MNFSPEHIELFDRYNEGELSTEELQMLENRLKNDPEFKTKFENFNAFEQQIKAAEITAFKNKLNDWDKDIQAAQTKPTEPIKKGRIIPLKLISIAAVFAICGFFIVTYFFSGLTHQELAENHFTPYDNVVTVRGAKADIDNGLKLYEEKKYHQALLIFERYPENETANFYAAESYQSLKQYPEAIIAYQTTLKTATIFSEIASFHLGLAYLGNNNPAAAVQQFESIASESDYFDEAKLLLSDLK